MKTQAISFKGKKERVEFKNTPESFETNRNVFETIAKKIYRAKDVKYSRKASKDIEKIESIGFGSLPICIAKTQYSLSDNPKLLNLNNEYNYDINIEEVNIFSGAGFIVPIAGNIMTMPGLPMKPNSSNFKIDEDGNVSGVE